MDSSSVFDLYQQMAPAELFGLLQRQMGVIVRDGIYSARLVMWMMIDQRLDIRGTLASSVEQLVQGRFDPLLSRCKRVQEKKIAVSTGGYCQARQHLPKLLVRRSMDELIEGPSKPPGGEIRLSVSTASVFIGRIVGAVGACARTGEGIPTGE